MAWCTRVNELTARFTTAATDFAEVSGSYAAARDAATNDSEKEATDKCYHDLVEALNTVKGLQAGGRRRRNRRLSRRNRR